MCGKTLRQPSPLRPAEMEEPAPVYLPDLRERGAPVARQVTESAPSATSISGPSFLGLGDQTSAPEFSYLLEDEPSRGPGRILLALVIILAVAEQAVRKQPSSEDEPSDSKSPKNTEAAVRKPAVGENASAKSKTPRSGAEQATSGESGDEEAASEPDTRPVEAKKLAAKTQQAARSPEDSNVL